MFEGLGCMYDLQRKLSVAQAVPIVGPLFVSPVKAVVSTVHAFASLFFASICATGAFLFCNPNLAKHTCTLATHAALGFTSLAYSIGNMASLGLLGYTIEIDSKPAFGITVQA